MIDTAVPGSPGYWMQKLWTRLRNKERRLALLNAYYFGLPPLPLGSESWTQTFLAFQRVARSNFASLIVQAPTERLALRSFSTAAAGDENGDQAAWRIWAGNNLDVDSSDVHRMAYEFGEAYVIVGAPDDGSDLPVITSEDPRQVITVADPINPRRTVAAFKIFHDDMTDEDLAYLWLPGEMWVARRDRHAPVPAPFAPLAGPPPLRPVSFSAQTFTIDEEMSESYAVRDVPVVRFANRDGVGEFELHTDLLDRINHMLLQRVVIATFQAFRQRAIEVPDVESLPDVDDEGKPIDYDDLFSADPGALWRIPPNSHIWESGQVDLTGILSAVKDDVLHLAAVTRTPLSMFTPDAATQSAEGANFQREGLTYKVEDSQRNFGRSWAKVMSAAFAFTGDMARADLGSIGVDWMPAERYSIGERASADSLSTLPFEQKLRLIWQMTPQEIELAKMQRSADLTYTAAVSKAQAPPTPTPAPPPRVTVVPADPAPPATG